MDQRSCCSDACNARDTVLADLQERHAKLEQQVESQGQVLDSIIEELTIHENHYLRLGAAVEMMSRTFISDLEKDTAIS